MLAITMRQEYVKDKKRLTISQSFNDIFEKLNIKYIPIGSTTMVDYAVKNCEGLIITGSPIHVSPNLYCNSNDIKKSDLIEDKLDLALIKAFYETGKPILGICRGIQILNVYFGGTLKERIENHEGVRHDISISNNSHLYNIYNDAKINVNSSHVQAIDKLAPVFKITSYSDDGIIEGIEYKNILGIQWHPEKDLDYKFFQKYKETYLDK